MAARPAHDIGPTGAGRRRTRFEMTAQPEPTRSTASADPVLVVLGSAVNAYGLVRSLGAVGIRSIVADWRRGPASYSKYVGARWRIPPVFRRQAFVEALLEHATRLPARPMLVPTSEAWVVAILEHRERLERSFRLPLGDSDVIRLALVKTRMHDWCLSHGIPVPYATSFEPGEDWAAFVRRAADHFPIIVKPETKGVGDEGLGFMYKRFDDAEAFTAWAETQGGAGPPCGVLCQAVIPGPISNLLSYQGYRARDGRVYMGGFTKLRQTGPWLGCATAAYMAADEPTKQLTREVLEKLGFTGFFDAELKRDERDGKLYFIEVNPRPGMLNYVATLQGVNLARIALADCYGQALPDAKTVTGIPGLWVHLTRDFMHSVVQHRTWRLGEWARSLRGHRLVDAYYNPRDPLVFAVGLLHTAGLFGRFLLKAALKHTGLLPRLRARWIRSAT